MEATVVATTSVELEVVAAVAAPPDSASPPINPPIATADAIASETSPLRSSPILNPPEAGISSPAQSSARNLAGACDPDRNSLEMIGEIPRLTHALEN